MKKFIMLLGIVAMVVFALVPAGSVSAQKFPGYVTGTQIMNLGGTAAAVTLNYYSADDGATGGIVVDTVNDTINPNSSTTYFPTLTSFKGSMVVSSSQPLGAVTNLQNSAKTAGASYVGASAGATIVQLPLLMKNNGGVPYDTWFSVQNAGSAVANVKVFYSDCTANAATEADASATIKAGASVTFSQASETCHPAKSVFAGSIESDQPIVVVVVQENTAKLFAYSGFAGEAGDISENLVMPLINANNNTMTTGVQIMNTGDTVSDVTVSYSPSTIAGVTYGTACTEKQTIQPKASATYALYAFYAGTRPAGITTDCVGGQTFIGSARVTINSATMPLVGIVNQNKPVYGEAYGAFNPDNATPQVVLPLLMDRNGSAQWSTGFAIMNVGGAATFVKCAMTNLPTGVTYAPSQELASFEAMTPNMKGQIGTGSYVGSGTCTAYTDNTYATVDTAAKLVGVVNESGIPVVDRLLVYEGINVVVP
jgi:hypothetical protein